MKYNVKLYPDYYQNPEWWKKLCFKFSSEILNDQCAHFKFIQEHRGSIIVDEDNDEIIDYIEFESEEDFTLFVLSI
jgi:hypothetical protein